MSVREHLTTPLQGSAEPARRLLVGTGRLAGSGIRWVVEVPGEILERALGVGLLTAMAGGIADQAPMLSGPAGFAAWGVAAWKAGAPLVDDQDQVMEGAPAAGDPDQTNDGQDQDVAGEGHQEATVPLPDFTPAELAQYVERAVADVHHLHQAAGIHLHVLLDGLHRMGRCTTWDRDRLRRELRGIKIPVHEGVNLRVGGRRLNRLGVRYQDVVKALGHAPRISPHLVPDLTPESGPSHTPGRAPAPGAG